MTVGELMDLLQEVERDRTIYVPGEDMKAEVLDYVVDLKHMNLPIEMKGIAIPDDVALLPTSIFEMFAPDDEDEEGT